MKATSIRGIVFAQVGDPYADHNCWERPEDMDTPRTAFAVSRDHPGSEVSAEIQLLLPPLQFGYQHGCSRPQSALTTWITLTKTIQNLKNFAEFGWDSKDASINVLLPKLLINSSSNSKPLILNNADKFVCSVLPKSPLLSVSYSPGGLLFKPGGSNMQHATAISFRFLVYAGYLRKTNKAIDCRSQVFASPKRLKQIARGQISTLATSVAKEDPFILKAKIQTGAAVGGPHFKDSYTDSRPDFVRSEPTTYINAPLVGLLAYFNSHPS
ncbi:hypothetical protein VNO78_04949 [Psophocarpus tetragonolobus]|uniref:Endoglucanase n=1 Tax=Psophocarpus tetragonolobus TaxID=3891 RepID=A0AAN9SSD8_PSOTE